MLSYTSIARGLPVLSGAHLAEAFRAQLSKPLPADLVAQLQQLPPFDRRRLQVALARGARAAEAAATPAPPSSHVIADASASATAAAMPSLAGAAPLAAGTKKHPCTIQANPACIKPRMGGGWSSKAQQARPAPQLARQPQQQHQQPQKQLPPHPHPHPLLQQQLQLQQPPTLPPPPQQQQLRQQPLPPPPPPSPQPQQQQPQQQQGQQKQKQPHVPESTQQGPQKELPCHKQEPLLSSCNSGKQGPVILPAVVSNLTIFG